MAGSPESCTGRRDPVSLDSLGAALVAFEADDARYMNHADDPNCDFGQGDVAYALRDIAPGEEMTCDYNVFFEDGFEFLGDR